MFRSRSVAFAAMAAAFAGGCSGSSGGHPTAAGTPAASALAALAGRGTSAHYSAGYVFAQASTKATATVRVWRDDPSLRVDVVSGTTTATLITTPTGSYSCSIAGSKRSCLLVAKGGAPLPPPFDVAPAALFSADVRTLAAQADAYDVRAAAPLPASGGVPSASCFDVGPRASTAPTVSSASPGVSAATPASAAPGASASSGATAPGAVATSTVPTGRYCLSATGLLVAASFPSGNTIQLTQLSEQAPPPSSFTPYARPTPLPT